jgi:cellulose biosynthesis protein BcsQ
MQTVCFFNNKGGVGKTTLVTNIASCFATELKKRVLVIDLDPQCNTTQLLLDEQRQEELINNPNGIGTILEIIEPLRDGDSIINTNFTPLDSSSNAFKVSLIPGHPGLSLFEDNLSRSWLDMQSGLPSGLRQSLWLDQFQNQISSEYDLTFIDVGPSFGALNRTVLLGCEYFVSPLGCDLFSIIGLKNIGSWLKESQQTFNEALESIKKRRGLDRLLEYGGTDIADKTFSRLIGYTVLQYITKSKGGERRPTEAFERFRREIPAVVTASLGDHTAHSLSAGSLDLGDVPNMYSIVPLAQYAQKPVHLLTGKDGLTGAAFAQHKHYVSFIKALTYALNDNLLHVTGAD